MRSRSLQLLTAAFIMLPQLYAHCDDTKGGLQPAVANGSSSLTTPTLSLIDKSPMAWAVSANRQSISNDAQYEPKDGTPPGLTTRSSSAVLTVAGGQSKTRSSISWPAVWSFWRLHSNDANDSLSQTLYNLTLSHLSDAEKESLLRGNTFSARDVDAVVRALNEYITGTDRAPDSIGPTHSIVLKALKLKEKYPGLLESARYRARISKVLNDPYSYLPAHMATVGAEELQVGDTTLLSPSFVYSNRMLWSDIGVRGFLGPTNGYGIGLTVDPIGGSMINHAAYKVQATGGTSLSEMETEVTLLTALSQRAKALDEYAADVPRIYMGTRISLLAAYNRFDDRSEIASSGLAASWLGRLPMDARPAPGLLVLANAEWISYRLPGYTKKTLRWGLGLAIQDKAPVDEGIKKGISRWKWQYGVEYSQVGSALINPSVDLFIRHRPSRLWEVGASVGKIIHGSEFAVVSFGFHIF